MNRRTFFFRILPILIAISAVLVCCSTIDWSSILKGLLSEAKEEQIPILNETYQINSADLLETLRQGKSDAFILLGPSQNVFPTPSTPRVEWKQSDFLYIAQALHEDVWNESLDGWLLREMRFGLDCADISSGPQSSFITFFKSQQTDKGPSRLARTFYIFADVNRITIDEGEYYPEIDQWPAIDLANVKIPVEDALQIAENNGGAQFRSETDNNCHIVADIDSYDNEEWVISYSSGSGDQEKSYELEINTLTGDYKKVQ
jgi:hypothetical protein